jgi:DUF3015 family protein
MKRIAWLGIVLAVVLLAGMVREGLAADCAVGGFVVNKRTGIIEQLLAFTTNGTFFITYAGAITTGTSGCSNSGIIKQEYEQQVFVAANYDALSGDMARGQGEYLAAMSALMGCPAALSGEFGQIARTHFDQIVSEAPGRAPALLAALKDAMRVHPALSASCARLA